MFEPVKAGFRQFVAAFYAQVQPTTPALAEFAARGLFDSVAMASGRMVDQAEEMLAAYLRDEHHTATAPARLPVILLAMAVDVIPTGRDYLRQLAAPEWVTIPGDPKERAFKMRTASNDLRAQVVIAAQNEPTARSLAAQFLLYLDAAPNRYFNSVHRFAGVDTDWPVEIETADVPFVRVQTDAKNLHLLAGDLTLKATVPLFMAPAAGEPNDGKGVPGTSDPAGYPLVSDVVTNFVEQA
ncbi:hypothetical protein [Uliginosibacterium sediminicola]|uniref:Uncharacterized protein n=1 Tax=Uliginosibacterium sediminicola TaxID=2024550 RepID=A0ABU9YW72_9RHOO